MSLDVYYSGPLMARRAKNDTLNRKDNGLLAHPPRLFVLHYSEQRDDVRGFEIDWEVADVLAPKEVAQIYEAMKADRSREASEAVKRA